MKKLFTIVTLITLCVTAFAQNGRDLYNKYSDLPGMEAVYISPAMFRMIGKIPDVEFQDESVNFAPVIKSMTGFYVLNATDPKIGADLYADVRKFIDGGKYELLMEAKENGEVARIYTVGDEQTVTSLVILAQEKSETAFIAIDGKMDRAQLEDLMAKAAAE